MALSKILPASQEQYAGARNLIINGAMQVAQRGTSHSVSTGGANYTLDRWALGVNAGVAVTVSQEDDTGDFNKFLRITGASGNTVTQLLTRLEAQDTKRLAGKEVTLSFYARSSSASTVVVYAAYPSATDNFTTTTNFANQSNSITTAFTRFTFTFTADTNVDKGLQILFGDNDGIGASATLDITGVQLEVGETATPFEHRSYGDELRRCQRYYEICNIKFNGYGVGGAHFIIPQKVTKRATPTATNGTSGSYTYNWTFVSISSDQNEMSINGTSSSGGYRVHRYGITLDAEL